LLDSAASVVGAAVEAFRVAVLDVVDLSTRTVDTGSAMTTTSLLRRFVNTLKRKKIKNKDQKAFRSLHYYLQKVRAVVGLLVSIYCFVCATVGGLDHRFHVLNSVCALV
jgi:hypothetical protein